MSDEATDLVPPELTADDVLRVPDDRFTTDTVAIVTGAGSGIGRATAVALASNELTVAALDIDEDGLDETVDVAGSVDADGRVVPIECDLTDDAAVEAAVEEAAELGTVRYAANIAGMQHIASLVDFPMDRYDLMHDLMLRSPFLLSKHVIPHIEATDDGVGAIANMSSIHGHYATQKKPAYITMKHGLTGLTRAIAAEGDGTLRGFSVSVGYVLTPLMVDQIEETAAERGITEQEVIEDVMLGQARTKEMMTPIEVANLFVFGFSSHARHLNGGDLCWDGGYTTTYE
ncbi:SDR family oxidoreductase [Natronococcus sp. A-GB7]|uniref:SDR family oxidoreductase n=1 Tax=Natronococcus sp. A-GB7 TaxID=3037649 RepID=UPI00241EAC53|nr:SDR family oxidoreductase [Natronococcus sp. A-GB7]MDG5817793.1 SDR family oxidoreductase [Natronococcus sp. A-GB7]